MRSVNVDDPIEDACDHSLVWEHGVVGIRSYSNRATKRFAQGDERRLPPEHAGKIRSLLKLLESGSSPESLRAAGHRVHRLTGNRSGYSAVEVSANLRLVFRFEGGNAYDVEVVDYHRS